MSAFEVDFTHIDVMVSAALQRGRHGDTLKWYHDVREEIPHTAPGEALPGHEDYISALKRTEREVTEDNAGIWGAALVAENRKSVNWRYAEDEWEEPYEFTRYEGTFDPVKMLKVISCYEYQSCEHPEWKTSEARAFCEALTGRMIGMIPGYSDGPWEVTDAAQVMIGQPMRVRRLTR